MTHACVKTTHAEQKTRPPVSRLPCGHDKARLHRWDERNSMHDRVTNGRNGWDFLDIPS